LRLCWHQLTIFLDYKVNFRTPNHLYKSFGPSSLGLPRTYTLLFWTICLIHYGTIWLLEVAKRCKLGTYGGRVAYLIKGDPDFIGCTSPHHHSLAPLLFVSGSLTKFFQRTIILIHLFY
jgi:hypothetical protein